MKDITTIAKVDIQSTLGTITSNLKEVKIKLDEEFKGLATKKVTLEELPEAKKSIAEARKLYTAIENKRKSIKREWNKPYTEFEAELKETISSLTAYINNIKEQVNELEEQEKKFKMERVNELITQRLENELSYIKDFVHKVDWFINPKWENKTFSMKKINEEIDSKVTQITNDLSIISEFDDKIYSSLLIEYQKHGNLSQTLILKDRLIADREREEKLKLEMLAQKKSEEEAREQAIIQEDLFTEPTQQVETNIIPNVDNGFIEEGESVPLTNDNWEEKTVATQPIETEPPKLEYKDESDNTQLEVTYLVKGDKAMIRFIKDMARFYGADIQMVGKPKVVR